jgi:hypothetical protein
MMGPVSLTDHSDGSPDPKEPIPPPPHTRTAPPSHHQMILFWLVPESPRWLLRADKRDEARHVLMTLRKDNPAAVDAELRALEKELGETMNQPAASWSEVRGCWGVAVGVGVGAGWVFLSD